tara:strand:+ start:147 stop:362 length:216 start_codon:yes stop_codon:yes gene_type:complete
MEVRRNKMNNESNDEILTIKKLAAYLKMAKKRIYRFVSEGKTPGFKVRSNWCFSKAEIEIWIKSPNKGQRQ